MKRLDHHALVSCGNRAVEEGARLVHSEVTSDGSRDVGGTIVASNSRRTNSGSSTVAAAGVQHVEEVGRQRGTATGRCISTEVPHRVLEAARRALVVDAEHLAVEHEVATGSPATNCGDAAEAIGMSLRLRAYSRTAPSRRWAWTRAPSSFHSTDAGPVAAMAAATSGGDASIGCTARPGDMAIDRSAGSPLDSAASAARPRSPDIMCAPHGGHRHRGGLGDRLDHHAVERRGGARR